MPLRESLAAAVGQDNVLNGFGGVRIPADQASVSGVGVNIDTVDYSGGANGTTILTGRLRDPTGVIRHSLPAWSRVFRRGV